MFASEDWDSDEDSEQLSDVAPVRLTAERQRRVWAIEPPARRDEILPYFVWSIVHDAERAEVDLKTFLEVSSPPPPGHALFESSFFCNVLRFLFGLFFMSVCTRSPNCGFLCYQMWAVCFYSRCCEIACTTVQV